ncbi:hypothetical protein AAG906_040601 [Vitis piasezkii]
MTKEKKVRNKNRHHTKQTMSEVIHLKDGSGSGIILVQDSRRGSQSGIGGQNFPRVNTLTSKMSKDDKLEPTWGQLKLERSKTERHNRHGNLCAEDAAQILDDKFLSSRRYIIIYTILDLPFTLCTRLQLPPSSKNELKLLNRIATVKDDGSVEFEVLGDIEPQALNIRSEDVYKGAVDDENLDSTDLQCIPPSTHANFKEFVLTSGLEFFPLGGDPKVLAGCFLPSGPSEIPIQRNQMKEIVYSLLPACKDPDMDSGIPFKADAIINPPAYGHTHVAEALKIPIHIFFTMPWTPTSEFPHPLSRVKQPAGYRLSYQIVDSMIWLGIRDMVNDMRKKKLKLRPVTYLSGSQGSDSDIPHGYIWSPHLVPKPKVIAYWGPKVDVVGFCLDLASNYEPPQELVKWLKLVKSLFILDLVAFLFKNQKMTQIIVDALEETGQRASLIKAGVALGTVMAQPKESIYLLDNCPHDWLFLQCKAVLSLVCNFLSGTSRGAGTTAAGLKAAVITVHARGVGPSPIPVEEFSLNKLVDAINFMLDPKVVCFFLLFNDLL